MIFEYGVALTLSFVGYLGALVFAGIAIYKHVLTDKGRDRESQEREASKSS